jgi:aminotransferase in exopolysaccharide biosynthesis
MFNPLITFIRDTYQSKDFIALHAPIFAGNESRYVQETIESTFVSSVGAFVDRFERDIATVTGSVGAVATVNGTAALHIALKLAGVQSGELVITQALTFVATCNAISYCNAQPVLLDVDQETLGLSPKAVSAWLASEAYRDNEGLCRHKATDKVIRACVPMHTFGHPADLAGLVSVCEQWGIMLVEDAAESLGSFYRGQHTGTFGDLSALSFNGNKIMTTGGGGMILCNTGELAKQAKHITTTAKVAHPFEYVHDQLGYNYRLPNINAALGCAQLEQLPHFLAEKRALAARYADFFIDSELTFVSEPEGCLSNYWLQAVICEDRMMRDDLLTQTNAAGVMTRQIWQLMHRLPMYENCLRDDLTQAQWLEDRVVNLPSGVRS